MIPKETAQAGVDLQAKYIMPIHWGAFNLAMHPWNEPVKRLTAKAATLNLKVILLKLKKNGSFRLVE